MYGYRINSGKAVIDENEACILNTMFHNYLNGMSLTENDLKKFIATLDHSITEYDETLARHMLSKITIFDDHIVFAFKSGVIVSVEM